MGECTVTAPGVPEDVGHFSPFKSLYIFINRFQQLAHKWIAP